MTDSTPREISVARFYDGVKFGLPTATPEQARFLGEHLLGQVGLRSSDLREWSVLEVGTGRGNWTSILSVEADEYEGVDLSPETVEYIRAHITPRVRVGNAKQIPFEEGRFDAAFAIGVLPAVDGDRMAFSELARILKKGGRLFLMGYGRVFPRNAIRDIIRRVTLGWTEEKKTKLCHQFTRWADLPIPEAWWFQGDQMYAQLDWYYAPIQNRHTRPQLEKWCAEEGLVPLAFSPYPHRCRMFFHEAASRLPGLSRWLGPDWFFVAQKSR